MARPGSPSVESGHTGRGMEHWLQRPVRLRGVQLGNVVDVILDADARDAVGLEVRCEDGQHRFLPMAAAKLVDRDVVVDSPFALLDADELAFYRERGIALRDTSRPLR